MAESVQHLKKRLKSVANINKITKAMEMVAATKMRKSQEIALASRPYAFVALDLLAHIREGDEKSSVFLKQRPVKKVLFVIISSDKGLAGSFNSSVFRKFEQHMQRDQEKYLSEEKLYMAVGQKAIQYAARKVLPLSRQFLNDADHVEPGNVSPVADAIIQGYLKNEWDRVVVVSMHFRSALRQEPHVRRILPVDFGHIKEIIGELVPETGKFAELIKENNIDFTAKEKTTAEYVIEPSPAVVLDKLAEHLLFMQIYHLMLEANAAEHSARRMAMKTASDNANDLGEALNLQYNKVRQASITNQIIEISAGTEAQT
ncbi:MAG TPA: ATP synthase F1 subunit gamma [Negativicutes bacterium]|nr:ATP synthase F1 subunit gamma [Negativicutes bacterium]